MLQPFITICYTSVHNKKKDKLRLETTLPTFITIHSFTIHVLNIIYNRNFFVLIKYNHKTYYMKRNKLESSYIMKCTDFMSKEV